MSDPQQDAVAPPFIGLDIDQIDAENEEFQSRCRAEAVDIKNLVYHACDQLKYYVDNYVEETFETHNAALNSEIEGYLDLERKTCIQLTKIVAEYRQAMEIKAQFALLVRRLAENDSETSPSQKSINSDHEGKCEVIDEEFRQKCEADHNLPFDSVLDEEDDVTVITK